MKLFIVLVILAGIIQRLLYSKKHWQYLGYILRHKYFVFIECCRIGMNQRDFLALAWRGIWHDWTKLLPSEWYAYVEHFYGEWKDYLNPKEDFLCPRAILNDFDTAWMNHIHRSQHHWQHWILYKDNGSIEVRDMPKRCVLEMVADWHGAGMAITGKKNTLIWYKKSKDKMTLSKNTRELVERLL